MIKIFKMYLCKVFDYIGGVLIPCPEGAGVISFLSSCYKISNFKATWAEARAYCQSMQYMGRGFDLAAFERWDEAARVLDAVEGLLGMKVYLI